MGCTEPIAVAYCAASARSALGCLPEKIKVEASCNIIKNVKSVVVPNTGQRRGIAAAACIGVLAGDETAGLEVLKNYGPAYLTAVGTMSSAATLAVALKSAGKSRNLRKDVVDFGIPLFANIHLCGSVLTEVFFAMAISRVL